MARDLRAHWAGLIGASLAVLVAAHVAPRFTPAPDLDENRRLASFPDWPASPAGLDAFRKGADAYVADNFPPRAQLIGALNWLRMQIGVSGSPRVLVGRDGWLFSDNGSHMGAARGQPALPDEAARAWLAGLAGRTEWLQARGAAYVVIAAPDKETVYPQYGPRWYAGPDLNRPAVTLQRLAQASGAGLVVYPHAEIKQYADWGLKTYAARDTHWTGLGAYVAYAALMRELQRQGLTEGPRPLESFTEVRIGARNKPRNLALMLGVASFVDVDYPELDDPAAARRLRVTPLAGGGDWTKPRVIDTGEVGKPVLLMTMDSFSNAFIPFLYSHFSRIVLAHNQDGAWREDLIERFDPDIVLLEVVETGLPSVMSPAPPPSPQAQARVARTVAERARYLVRPRSRAPAAAPQEVAGTEGPDRLRGSQLAEVISGFKGDDVIEAGGGPDLVRGGRGRDAIDGGEDDDWLSGGRDDDVLKGGPGADVFNSFEGAGVDRVLDFSVTEGDSVELDAGAPFTIRQAGADTIIELNGAQVVLVGVDARSLPPHAVRNWRP